MVFQKDVLFFAKAVGVTSIMSNIEMKSCFTLYAVQNPQNQ